MRIRVACHVHSDWSYDGKWPLSRIAAAFSKRGYQAVLLTEHDRGFDESRRLEHREACRKASTDKILLVPGIEYSDGANCVHILAWGNVPFIGVDAETETVLAAVAASRGVAVLAHPSRKQAWKQFKPNWAANLAGIESWNRKTDGWAPSREAQLLLNATKIQPFVGMDFHDRRQLFPLAMVLHGNSEVSEAAILESIYAKRCSFKAFGAPVDFLVRGARGTMLRLAEIFRRRSARIFHRLCG
ncbi:MAG: hypothetical protein ACREE6_05865 [Limisphaerales bacterium]